MEHPRHKPYIVILAGGGGTRLWPKSTKSMPKQFLKLFSHRTLLQETYARIAPITDKDRILVVSSVKYKEEILSQLPDLKEDNLILEPMAKNTAAAIGFACTVVAERDKDAIVHSLHSDHFIGEVDTFQRVLLSASIMAEKRDDIILWGVVPNRPAPELGYIQSGQELEEVNGIPLFAVKGFKEKPQVAMAQAYIATGRYFWNHGYFSQKVSVMLDAIKTFMPELFRGLELIKESIGKDNYQDTIVSEFEKFESVAIDVGVVEKANNIVMIPAPYPWSDVGSWDALFEILPKNDDTNCVTPDPAYHVGLDSHGCLVAADGKLISTIGLRDLIVVDTPNSLLICPKNRSQDVKKLIEELKRRGKDMVL
mgnify:CR=1 FL=1